jgi:hypothetical protein
MNREDWPAQLAAACLIAGAIAAVVGAVLFTILPP